MLWSKLFAVFAVFAILVFFMYSSISDTDRVLIASHQWPDNEGDIRDEMIRIIASEVKAANAGISIKIYPGKSLYKPKEQWGAIIRGDLDMSAFPLAYASSRHPEFNLTLMPSLIKSHEHARRMNNSVFMKQIKEIIESAGAVVLADAWLAGGIVSKKKCILVPEDLKGQTVRGAGKAFNEMFSGAGASITTMPSSEIYSAMKIGVLDGASTSSTSLVSYRLYEQATCLTAPGKNTLWFMYEPILMSKQTYNSLTPQQQELIRLAAKKAEEFAYKEAIEADKELIIKYKNSGIKVVRMSDKQAMKWKGLIKRTSHKNFTQEVKNGRELLDMALSVQ